MEGLEASTNSTPSPPPSDALFECDPTAPLPTANAFRQQAIPRLPVDGSTIRHNNLCDGRWQWYRVETAYSREVPTTERVLGSDGVMRTETTTSTVDDVASLVILFDSVWTRQANRFPTSDIMVVNGMNNMPVNWDVPSLFQPENAVNNAPEPGIVHWRTGVDSLTMTIGYNTTLGWNGCAAPMQPLLMVGVRCSWGQAIACRYDISARQVPRRIYDGDVIEAPIAAGELHPFALDIGSFDVVTLTLHRLNHDLTYEDPDTGDTHVHDFAIRGQFLAQRGYCPNLEASPPPPPPPSPPPDPFPPPPPPTTLFGLGSIGSAASSTAVAASSESDEDRGGPIFMQRTVPITNASGVSVMEFFCTSEEDSGPWVVAVHAAEVQGPIALPHETTTPTAASCADGYVGPQGVPIYTSPSALGSLPQCNPSGGGNELRPNRPTYRLDVVHRAFTDEPLAPREVRPGCIAYGQIRRYSVTADGETAANLYVALSMRASRVLIAADRPPTMSDYDVASVDEAVLGEEAPAENVVVAPGTELQTTVSASPCDPSRTRVWHLAVYLSEESIAHAQGLTQAAFDLNSTLSSALQQPPEGGVHLIAPRSEGGVGSTCCGGMTHFMVRLNNSILALRVKLKVTAGALRAVYVKHGTCAVYPQDILGQQCDAQVAQCHMTWYERFDRYTGEKRYAMGNTTLVPAGGNSPDKRAMGEWYISVQDAGVARRTDFSVEIDAIVPPRIEMEASCDRYGRYDCTNDIWRVPPDLNFFASAAPPRAGATFVALLLPWLLVILAVTRSVRGPGAWRWSCE